MGQHPSIDFPVYELVEPDLTPRWLSMISGSVGERPIGVTLAFGWIDDRGDLWADVTTGFRQGVPPDGWSPADWNWYDGGLDVLICAPTNDGTPAGQVWRAAVDAFNADHEAHYRAWSAQTWTIDGQPVEARSFDIDGAWAALCFAPSGVAIYAYGRSVEPANLILHSTDGRRYGIDFREPLHFPESIMTSRALAREG